LIKMTQTGGRVHFVGESAQFDEFVEFSSGLMHPTTLSDTSTTFCGHTLVFTHTHTHTHTHTNTHTNTHTHTHTHDAFKRCIQTQVADMEALASEGRVHVRKLLAKQHHELNLLTRHMQSTIRDELRPEIEQNKKGKTIKSAPPRHTHVPHRPGDMTNSTHEHHPLSQSSSNASDGLGNASDGLGDTAAFAFPAPEAGPFLFLFLFNFFWIVRAAMPHLPSTHTHTHTHTYTHARTHAHTTHTTHTHTHTHTHTWSRKCSVSAERATDAGACTTPPLINVFPQEHVLRLLL
jgi:hypothetical protein